MSQAKVDQYKKSKAHRKQSMRREKLERALAWIIVAAIAAAICIWIGFSIYSRVNGSSSTDTSSSTVSVNTDAVDNYLDELGSESAEEE